LRLRDGLPDHPRHLLAELDDVNGLIAIFAFLGEWICPLQLEMVLSALDRTVGLEPAEMFARLGRIYAAIEYTATGGDEA